MLALKIYIQEQNVLTYGQFIFSGDYNPIHNHAAGETGLSFIFKFPEKIKICIQHPEKKMDVPHLLEIVMETSLIFKLLIQKFMYQKLDIF